MANQLALFIQQLLTSTEKQELIKITLGNKREKAAEVKNVFIKLVFLKAIPKLSFVYRYPTRDSTKNFDIKEGVHLIEKMLQQEFYNADVFTTTHDYHLSIHKNEQAKIVTKPATLSARPDAHLHDKQKQRIIKATDKIYLHELGITTADGVVKKDMQDKYKQINRYVEIIEGIIKGLNFADGLKVVDMGSGKGYLTFALYDYLQNILKVQAHIEGIELRPELVHACNQVAEKSNFSNLIFTTGSIQDTTLKSVDMLIALHACDTATDDAIYKGIKANAKVIICVPCCHKQIRKQMRPDNVLQSITKHGILLERQAEMVTDALRALLLEAYGYTTKVFEFISTEHTPKNVLIVGVKAAKENTKHAENIGKVKALKQLFNIQEHYLEKLLGMEA
jgi:tRNA A58 N-methylase Trm61